MRESSHIKVELIDIAPLELEAKNLVPKATRCISRYQHGIVRTETGMYALCSEGVGNSDPVTDNDPYVIDLYSQTDHRDGKSTGSMFPVITAKLVPSSLLEYLTGETVDLADFIRIFGDRLETNFKQWCRVLR